jgi:hypothetical protein
MVGNSSSWCGWRKLRVVVAGKDTFAQLRYELRICVIRLIFTSFSSFYYLPFPTLCAQETCTTSAQKQLDRRSRTQMKKGPEKRAEAERER